MREFAFRLVPLLCLTLAACGSGGGGRPGDSRAAPRWNARRLPAP